MTKLAWLTAAAVTGLSGCSTTSAQDGDAGTGATTTPTPGDDANTTTSSGDDANTTTPTSGDDANTTTPAPGDDADTTTPDGSPPTDVDAGTPLTGDAGYATGPEPGSPVTGGGLSITAVYASRIGQDLHLEIDGMGFGSAPRTLPAVTELSQFGITDTTQGSWCAGKGGCPVNLQYTSWTDSRIVIDGFGTEYGGAYKIFPGDSVSIFVQSTASGGDSATWTGTLLPEAPPVLEPNGPTPQVAAVAFSRIGQDIHIEVSGAGFGLAPRTLPAVTELTQFGLTDTTQGSWCAGKNGCPLNLQYTSWSDGLIVVDGFGTEYGSQYQVFTGDTVSIYLQNSTGPEFTIWTGTLQAGAAPPPDPGKPTPEIATVTFSQVGQNLTIEVDGSGFGVAPRTLPATTELTQFGFTDATKGGWCAGKNGCPVNLQYTSWTDARIVVDGFGTEYGGQYTVASGDSVSIFVENSGGPEFTIWNGALP